MQNHITIPELQDLMERFAQEYPYGDSFDLAEFMFNAGFEAGEQGGLDNVNFEDPDKTPDSGTDDTETYFQPMSYMDDGTNLEYGDIPEGMFSHQVFRSEEDCEQWLADHGYDPGDWVIKEYHGDDIEEHVYIEP